MGSFHGEHIGPLLQKHLVLGSLQHCRKGDTSLRDPQGRACAATALPLLQEQAVKAAAHEIPLK